MRNLSDKYGKQLLDTAKKNRNKSVIHKAAEATCELLAIVEEIIIPPKKREEVLNELRQVL